MADALRRLGIFAAVLVLVVGAATVFGLVVADAPPERVDATVDKDHFTSQALLEDAELAERSGDIEPGGGPERTVVVSTARSPAEIEPVLRALVAAGHEVRLRDHGGNIPAGLPVSVIGRVGPTRPSGSEEGPPLSATLDDADALLVVGGSQLRQSEYGTVENFTEAGGRLMVATDPFGGFGGSDGESLLSRYGISVGDGYVYNMHVNDANYQRVFAESTNAELANGISDVVVDGAAPLWSENGEALVTAAGESRYSKTRASGSFDVAVRNGNALAIGDVDVMQDTNYNRAGNNNLLGNALGFLTGGPSDPYDPPQPSVGEQPNRRRQPGASQPPAQQSGA